MGKKFQDNCKKQAKILTCKFKNAIFAKNKNDISPLKARDAQKSECKKVREKESDSKNEIFLSNFLHKY